MESIKKCKCENCNISFLLSDKQIDFINPLLKRGQSFIMIECPSCRLPTKYKASNKSLENLNTESKPFSWRCPVIHCSGWVSLINDETTAFFGCGECGSIWYEEKNFQKEITHIISLYSYRKKCYEMILDKWIPSVIKNEDKNYESLIESEPFDKNKSFIRG